MPSLGDMLRDMGAESDALERPKLAPDIEAIRLRDALAALNVRHEFRPGMIVRQKPQAQSYQTLGGNDMAIVVELLDEPIIDDESEVGSAYYRQRLDMIIGAIFPRGARVTFNFYHVDSRRFEPVPEDEIAFLAEGGERR